MGKMPGELAKLRSVSNIRNPKSLDLKVILEVLVTWMTRACSPQLIQK